jgi:hypothetical protein
MNTIIYTMLTHLPAPYILHVDLGVSDLERCDFEPHPGLLFVGNYLVSGQSWHILWKPYLKKTTEVEWCDSRSTVPDLQE